MSFQKEIILKELKDNVYIDALYQILDLGERLYFVLDPQSQRDNNISTYFKLIVC